MVPIRQSRRREIFVEPGKESFPSSVGEFAARVFLIGTVASARRPYLYQAGRHWRITLLPAMRID